MATIARGSEGSSRFFQDSAQVDPEGSFAQLPLFRTLTRDELGELEAASSSHRVPRSQIVFNEGETLTNLYIAQRGCFKLSRHSEAGKELIVSLVRPGECFGALAGPLESRTLARALEDSVLLVVPLSALRRPLANNAPFATALLHQALQRHEHAETTATRLAFETVPERLAHLLLEVSDPDSGELVVPLNQSEIANLIGSSRETVCSILNQFRRQGLLDIERGRLRIIERGLLDGVK